jgi:16S rRNA (uracil1498-N3)-methyltransferase
MSLSYLTDKHLTDKHLFAFFVPLLSEKVISQGSLFECHDEALWLRITQVLRLKQDEQFLLFDQHVHVTLTLHEKTFAHKKKLWGIVLLIEKNQRLKPEIILYQCLTKKTVFEEIIYAGAQLGVAQVIPLISAKVQRSWGGEKEMMRLESISHAACEQAKNFIPPGISNPHAFSSLLQKQPGEPDSVKLFFDVEGLPLFAFLKELSHDNRVIEKKITIVIGPEGGLTSEERVLLQKNGFSCYALTPTILRAQDAVMVGVGSIRCMTT